MPFENTLDGADETDVRNLADHLQGHFPEWKPRIDQARTTINHRLRAPMERAVVYKAIEALFERKRRTAQKT